MKRTWVTPARPPGHGITAPEHRLLLFGHELIIPPETRQGPPRRKPARLGFTRAEDAEQLPGSGAAELGDRLELLRGGAGFSESGDGLASPPRPAEPASTADEHDRGQDHPDR